jgi:NhaP-type Na+/H+ or K+/H+ antiporter
MTMTAKDPFERAAAREAWMQRRRSSRTSGTGWALRAFLFPYLVWGGLRATNHDWSTPPIPGTAVRFFFGSFAFGILTGMVLVLIWAWLLERGRRRAARERS